MFWIKQRENKHTKTKNKKKNNGVVQMFTIDASHVGKKKSIKPIKAQRNAKNLTEAAGTEGHGKSQCTSKSEEIYSTAASDRWKP